MKKFVVVALVAAMLLAMSMSAFAAETAAPADLVSQVEGIAAQVSYYCDMVQEILQVAKNTIDQISIIVEQVDQMAQLIVVAAQEVASIQQSILDVQAVLVPAVQELTAAFAA